MSNKQVYHVFYLGWMEAESLCDKYFVDMVVNNLITKQYMSQLNELVLQLNTKCLKIYQLTRRGSGCEKRVKFPSVPIRDITYVRQADGDKSDLVAFVILGFSSQTRAVAHVHVYKCKSVEEASSFAMFANSKIQTVQNQRYIRTVESDLIKKGILKPSRIMSAFSFSTENIPQERRSSVSPNDQQICNLLTSLNKEFKNKLSTKEFYLENENDSEAEEVFDKVDSISIDKIVDCIKQSSRSRSARKCSLPVIGPSPALKPKSHGHCTRPVSDSTEPATEANIGQCGRSLIDTRPLRLASNFRNSPRNHSIDIVDRQACPISG